MENKVLDETSKLKLLEYFHETLLEFNKHYIYPRVTVDFSNENSLKLTFCDILNDSPHADSEYYSIRFHLITGVISFHDSSQLATQNNLSIQINGSVYYTKYGKITNILQYVAGVIKWHTHNLKKWNRIPNPRAWKSFVNAHPSLEIDSVREVLTESV